MLCGPVAGSRRLTASQPPTTTDHRLHRQAPCVVGHRVASPPCERTSLSRKFPCAARCRRCSTRLLACASTSGPTTCSTSTVLAERARVVFPPGGQDERWRRPPRQRTRGVLRGFRRPGRHACVRRRPRRASDARAPARPRGTASASDCCGAVCACMAPWPQTSPSRKGTHSSATRIGAARCSRRPSSAVAVAASARSMLLPNG
jgi:hypothetical protein